MATEYATLVFKADTKELGQAYNQLKKLNEQGKVSDQTFKSFERQLKSVRAGARGAGANIGGMGRSAGQAGIQVQQLVGQIQAGTNPMLALSQQAADLGFVLGAPLIGAIAGIGASVAMVLLPSLFNSAEAASELKESIEDMYDSFDQMTPAVRRFVQLDLEAKLKEQEIAAHNAEIMLQRHARTMAADADSSEESINKLIELQATQELATAKAAAYREQIEELKNATGEQNEAVASMIERLEEQAVELSENGEAVLRYKLIKEDATQAEIDYAIALYRSNQAIEAQRKLEEEKEAFTERLRKAAVQKTEALKREQEAADQKAVQDARARQEAEDQRIIERVQQMQQAERDLQAQGLLEREADENASYDRRLAKLQEYKQKQLITEQQFNEAKKELDKQTTQAAIDQFGEGLTALGQYNKTAFKAAKAFNIAQAIMNTYTGATKALATYPPPFNFIAAAGVVMSGMAQVQSIRSQQYQGRALGGQVRAGESYVVGERGAEVLTMGNSSGKIIPNDKLGGQQQPVNKVANVTFQISTVDARGFDQLLQSRRGQIVNMVNSAMNDQGRRGVA